tara:strand:+ start:193 stop:492 length:300 start_codon:yes stop_codon:yes gene_type:complete
MKQESLKRTGVRVMELFLGFFLLFLGVALGWDLWEARKDTETSYREWKQADQELQRLLEENRRLGKELYALQNDPVYIESVLRQWRMARPGETVLVGDP